jgi:tetratricopeptide (TPR) repeat protein
MNIERTFRSLSALAVAVTFGACAAEVTRVKPGQSARQALAARNAPLPLVPMLPDDPALAPKPESAAGPLIVGPLPDIQGDPSLPEANDVANKVADAYTRGSFAMQAGQNVEAISALEEAVKLDPNFTDAWTKLVKLYEKTGNPAKAAEAYKKLKQLGQPNGAPGATPTGGGLGLIR